MPVNQDSAGKPPSQASWFATTHWSVILAAGQPEAPQAQEALERLCRTYWPPLYAYIRRSGYSPHDAQDLTQGFFARFLEKGWLAGVGPHKGKFRSFMLTALNHFLCDEHDRAKAAKRGGGESPVSLDDLPEESMGLELGNEYSPEQEFNRRWAITLLREALAQLSRQFQAAGKGAWFERLRPFLENEAGPGEYAAVAAELGMTSNRVAVAVHRMRQRYQELVRAEIANTVTTPQEIEEELRWMYATLVQ